MVVPLWVTGAKPMVRRSCDESSLKLTVYLANSLTLRLRFTFQHISNTVEWNGSPNALH